MSNARKRNKPLPFVLTSIRATYSNRKSEERGRNEHLSAHGSGSSRDSLGGGRRYSNSRFQLADVYNPTYNPHEKLRPTEYHFPFADYEFDFVYLTSDKIYRTLQTNGRCPRLAVSGLPMLGSERPQDKYPCRR
jgi:hypothetical protein